MKRLNVMICLWRMLCWHYFQRSKSNKLVIKCPLQSFVLLQFSNIFLRILVFCSNPILMIRPSFSSLRSNLLTLLLLLPLLILSLLSVLLLCCVSVIFRLWQMDKNGGKWSQKVCFLCIWKMWGSWSLCEVKCCKKFALPCSR